MLGLSVTIPTYHRIEPALNNGRSISFDGTNDYVDGSDVCPDINTTLGTFSIWVKLTTGSNNDGMWQISIGTSGDNKIGCVHNTSADVIRFFYKGDGTQVNADYSISEASLISADWTHVAGTWDAEGRDEIKLYVNGDLRDTTGSLTAFEGSPNRSILGKGANADNTYWQGNLDEFGLWKRVLSATEISEIYNEGVPRNLTEGYGTDLIQYLRFEEESGDALDSSDSSISSSHSATISGATQYQEDTPGG